MLSKLKIHWGIWSGLLYAGAAVGVSHLVMSTKKKRASYGYLLLLLIPIVHVIKYPFYRFDQNTRL